MADWIEPAEIEVPQRLDALVGGHPLVARTLVRRGITNVEEARAFLDPDHYQPTPPTELPNIVRAAERLESAIRQGESICVWGDFDVDGQTSTTILVSALRDLGADARFYMPTRDTGGHGVHLPALKRLISEGVDLVLTCDTGVTAHEPVAYAQTQGVDVIVTDHHDLPPELPEAHAVTDPKMLPETHPLRTLPGVGVAYKLAELLYERAGRAEETEQYLDLVALGIVADVATQTGDVRYLLQRGLERLRRTERLGLRVLMEIAEINPQWLTEEHIGFELAPRLNALGRLADAAPAVELLTTDDLERARVLAHELDGLNARRKMMCDQVMQGAEAQLERDPTLLEQGALVLSHPTWPSGVIGIVAGRLAEKSHRPTILIAAPPDELARGSARSVPGCDISAAIAAQGEMLEGFGGHPMAAGLSIQPDRIPEFRHALLRDPKGFLKPLGSKTIQIDGYVELSDISLDLVEQIERLAPFGPGNPPLTLASRNLTLRSHSTVGRTEEHLQLAVEDEEGVAQRVIWWRGAGERLPEATFDLAYTVRASDYRGQRQVQVEWIEARERAPVPSDKLQVAGGKWQVEDYRRDSQRLLAQLSALEDVAVWREGGAEIEGHARQGLRPARVLVVWTAPPGPAELRAALERVAPEVVYLAGDENDSISHQPQDFLKRLGGLVKRALNADGRVSVSSLAATTAQREATVRAGLDWLAARGHIAILEEAGDEVQLAAGDGVSSTELSRVTARLKALLEETKAYRKHFARADAETLLPE